MQKVAVLRGLGGIKLLDGELPADIDDHGLTVAKRVSSAGYLVPGLGVSAEAGPEQPRPFPPPSDT
jgi:hypothetical protein